MAKNSSPSRAPKNWRSTLGQPEEREKIAKRPKNPVKPPGRHKHRHTARRNNVQVSSANRAWTSEAPSRRNFEILPKAPGLTHERSTTAHRNNVQIFKCELGLRIGVHIHVENVEIQLKTRHLSLHIYKHVKELELHGNVNHLVDELQLQHHDNRPTRAAAPATTPTPPPAVPTCRRTRRQRAT